jgi:hypothetical protein
VVFIVAGWIMGRGERALQHSHREASR